MKHVPEGQVMSRRGYHEVLTQTDRHLLAPPQSSIPTVLYQQLSHHELLSATRQRRPLRRSRRLVYFQSHQQPRPLPTLSLR